MLRVITIPVLWFLLDCTFAFPSLAEAEPTTPKPFGAVPSTRQLQWHELEFYGLVHFGMNTFVNREWGAGDEPSALFNPTAFDAGQIIRAAKDAGMRGVVLVCKHHDGFCLWPSRFTQRSVKYSPWKNGQGDVVKDISEACRKEGLKFGVYLSPWDSSREDYSKPEYLTYYRNLLRELLTNYGEVSIVWFDGASGGPGYYGGARGVRKVDSQKYYQWPETWALVRSLQPQAVIFSDAGPDVRWVGNEWGNADDPCWATLNLAVCYPGMLDVHLLPSGERSGTNWVPAECDVRIRSGWFYHPQTDARVKSPLQLLDIYYKTVGRGTALDLGLAPDRRGLIPDPDLASLRDLGRMLQATFATNLAAAAKLSASNTRNKDDHFSPANLLDGKRETYWATDDSVTTPEVVLDLRKPVTFDVVRLREYLPLGQRVEGFALDSWQDGDWHELARGTSIGNQRLLRLEPVTTEKIRLRITQASACPTLSELGLFFEPESFRFRSSLLPHPLPPREQAGAGK